MMRLLLIYFLKANVDAEVCSLPTACSASSYQLVGHSHRLKNMFISTLTNVLVQYISLLEDSERAIAISTCSDNQFKRC